MVMWGWLWSLVVLVRSLFCFFFVVVVVVVVVVAAVVVVLVVVVTQDPTHGPKKTL
jgi:hypothetical protein